MAISTDATVKGLQDKIKFKDEELSFFASKIISQDSAADATKEIISALDTAVLQEIDAVNDKLEELQDAYQARVDEGCKSDLFWRVISVENIISGTSVSSVKYTLKCTRLSQTYEKIYFGRTEPYSNFEKSFFKTLKIPLPPLDDGLTVYYISDNLTPTVIGVSTATPLGTTGISTFRGDTTSYGTLSDNLYGIKYYDEPYAQDIGDTFVCSFPGKISTGSTVLTALSDSTYGGLENLEVGQILTSSKSSVFAAGFNVIVGIATTPGNTDPNNPSSPATASAGINTSYNLSGITIINGGTGFTTAPTVTISSPNAITAIGTAIVSSSGSITSVNITNPGTGYTAAPPVYFSTPGSYSAVGFGSTGALGIVTSVVVTNSGYGYTLAPTITFANPPVIGVGIGSTALGVAFISTSAGGIVTGVTLTFPGLGYTTSPSVTFASPGIHTAVGIATLGTGANAGIVTGVIVGTGLSNAGFGYTTSTPIRVIIGEPEKIQAVGDANVSSASTISSITLTEVGAGYTSVPTVDISDPSLQVISLITLQNTAIDSALAPEPDGSLVSFTASLSASNIVDLLTATPENLSIPFDKGTFSPQTVGIMSQSTVGIGVSIKYDNSGYPRGTESWKPEYAFPEIVIPKGKNIPAVEEPKVGAGKIYYLDGFDFYPIKIPGDSNSKAVEGDTIEVYTNTIFNSLTQFIEPCPTCSSPVTNQLNNAITEANNAKSQISSGIANLNVRIDAANQFRKDKNDSQLSIWGYRTVMGQLVEDKRRYENTLKVFNDPIIAGVFT